MRNATAVSSPRPDSNTRHHQAHASKIARWGRQTLGCIAIVAASLSGMLLVVSTAHATVDFFVAPSGDDANPGTVAQPFGSIRAAQRAVRQKVRAGLHDDVVVHLHQGRYPMDQPLEFGPFDGGTQDHSVTYVSVEGKQVTITGGQQIHGWQRRADGLWTVNLPDVKTGKWFFRQLYADGKRLPRGRYPDTGFLKIKTVSTDHKTLRFVQPLPDRDFGGQDTEVIVVQNWSISRERIAASTPETLTAETPIGWIGHSHCLAKPGMSAFLENSLALVHQRGQWYLDRKSGTLYYKAAPGEDPNQHRFVAPRAAQLIVIKGSGGHAVRNLHFKGLTLAHTNWLIPSIGYGGIQACYHGTNSDQAVCFAVDVAVELSHCENCSIERCGLEHVGGSGIGLGAGCRNNRVVGCLIRDIGATGVNVGHMKSKNPLWADWSDPNEVPFNNEVANCYIHDCGADLWGAHGIFDAMTRNTRIRHNEVAALPYGGIATGYVWGTEQTSQRDCAIEFNHVHDVMLKLNDSGCIYTLGFQPGSVIRGNLLHGVRFGGFANGQICNNGIFFDEGSKGFRLEGNVIYDVDQAPGARNTAVRFNRSSHDWQTWVNNSIQTDAAVPDAAQQLARKAGLEPEYQGLLKDAK